jgi:antitoxin component YwqK of YwqJK toxin-antitoxin module
MLDHRILALVLLFTGQCAMAQNGFTKKEEAKSEIINGLKEGKWIEYLDEEWRPTAPSKAKYYRLTIYKTGKEQEIQRQYRVNGTLYMEIPCTDGEWDGLQKMYSGNGKKVISETPYSKGKREGMEKDYYASGKLLSEEFYEHDLKRSETDYYESGKIKSRQKFFAVQRYGLDPDTLFGYFETGELQRLIIYEYGNLSMKKEFFKTGIVKQEIPYVDNKIHGILKEYYETGAVKYESNCAYGKNDGPLKKYDKNGKLISTKYFKNGKKVKAG